MASGAASGEQPRAGVVSALSVIFLCVLVITAVPAQAATQLVVASNHTTDADFNSAATLENVTVSGSGNSASVGLLPDASDGFEDGNTNGWTIDEGGSSFSAVGSPTHTGSFAAEYAPSAGSFSNAVVLDEGEVSRETTTTASVYTLDDSGDPDIDGDSQYLVLRNISTDHQYYVRLSVGADFIRLGKINASGDHNLHQVSQPLSHDTFYNASATINETHVSVTVDDAAGTELQRFSVEDDELDPDSAGVGSFRNSPIFDDFQITNAPAGQYISANHSVERAEQWKINTTLENASMDVRGEYWDGSAWQVANSATLTTTANHTLDISGHADRTKWRLNATFDEQSGATTADLHDESVLFTARSPTVDNNSASPTGDLSQSDQTLSIDVNDTDFPLTQGDSVSVTFHTNRSGQVGSDTLTSNGTATTSHDFTSGGGTKWWVETTDDYGLEQRSDDFTVNVPSTLTIREEEPPHSKITSETVETTFFEDDDDSPTIINKTTTNGEIDLEGLPTGSQFSVQVSAPSYHNRTILVEDIFEQNNVFLINKTDGIDTIENRFVVSDRTGNFPNDETEIVIQAPINQSIYNTGGFAWLNVAGDDLGADEGFTTDLVDEKRYRIKVQNDDGDTRILGAYTAETAGVINLNIGSVRVNPEEPDGVAFEATWRNETGSDPEVRVEYNDTASDTSTLYVHIYEYRNQSNELLANTSFTGPLGTFATTETVPSGEEDTTWVVEITGDRGGDNVNAKRIVGPGAPVLSDMPQWLVAVFFVGIIWMVAGLFSQVNGDIGGVVVAGLGAILYFVDLVPGYLGGGVVALSLLTAGILFIRERQGGGL